MLRLNTYLTQSTSLRIKKILHQEHLIFPNPSNDFITVKNLNSTIAYEIINLSGKRVKTGISDGEIEIKNLENGIYFLQISSGYNYKVLKFIKCK